MCVIFEDISHHIAYKWQRKVLFQVIWRSDVNLFYDLFSFKLSFLVYFFIKSILHSGKNVILGVNKLCDIVYNKYFECQVFILCLLIKRNEKGTKY